MISTGTAVLIAAYIKLYPELFSIGGNFFQINKPDLFSLKTGRRSDFAVTVKFLIRILGRQINP